LADIFDEVAEDLRRDRALKAWKRYGGWVIGAAVAVVAGVGLHQGWTWWESKARLERAQSYEAARSFLDAGDNASALGTFANLSQGDDGFAVLARLQAAAAQISSGDKAAGIEAYQALAKDQAVPETYRLLGGMMAVMHQSDDGDPDALLAELAPALAQTSPWRFSAREIAAGIALRKGDKSAARQFLQTSADDLAAPNAVRSRAGQLLQAIGQ